MITDEKIEMTICYANYKYWVAKGYNLPPLNGKSYPFMVDIKDLPPNSNIRVTCKCDRCDTTFTNRYTRNTDTCQKCFKTFSMQGNTHGKNNRTSSIPSKEDLEKFIAMGLGKAAIAKHYGVTLAVVIGWIKHHKIMMPPYAGIVLRVTKEELENQHHIQKMTIEKIAEYHNTSRQTIMRYFIKFGIETKIYRQKRKMIFGIEELRHMHHDQKKTLKEISEICGVSDVLIGKWFEELEIEKKYHSMNGVSNAELELKAFLNTDNGFSFVKDKSILRGLEIDLYDKNMKVAIEYCGLFWHSETVLKDRSNDVKNYHRHKFIECANNGITLITVFEDEWLQKQEIVKQRILSILGKYQTRIFARKCSIIEMDFTASSTFFEKSHLQGKPNHITKCFGLVHENDIVAAMSFGLHHRNRKVIVLNRFSTLPAIQVVGGAQRLFANATKIFDYIITWSDNRWTNGNLYANLGFSLAEELPPDYSYTRRQQRFNKQSMTKKILNCPADKTEREYALELGFHVIWDCGKKRWEWKK